MFRGFFALLAGIVLFAVVGVAVADEIKGKIKSTDDTKKTITVENKDNKDGLVIYFDVDKTKVKLGKKDGAFSDLKADQAVTVTYDKKDGKNVASDIKAGKGK